MTKIARKLCPICSRPAKPETRPFCSTRCADVDLGRWLTGSYAIPVPPDERENDDPQENRAGHDGAD